MLPGDMDRMNLKNVEIKDFYKELPKHEYTLMEWIEFVERNPQYVQAIREDVQQIPKTVMAITSGLDNVQEVITL